MKRGAISVYEIRLGNAQDAEINENSDAFVDAQFDEEDPQSFAVANYPTIYSLIPPDRSMT